MRCKRLAPHQGDRKGLHIEAHLSWVVRASLPHQGDRKGPHPTSTPHPPLQRYAAVSPLLEITSYIVSALLPTKATARDSRHRHGLSCVVRASRPTRATASV